MRRSVPGRVEDDVRLETLAGLRIPFVRRVTVRHQDGQEDLFAIDLGLRGVFVERAEPLARGSTVEVAFLLPGNALPLAAGCRVAWWHAPGAALRSKRLPAGLGLEFVRVSAADLERVRLFLLDHLRREPGLRRFHRQWPEAEEGQDA